MASDSNRRETLRRHVDAKLRRQLQIYTIIFLAFCGVLVFDIVQNHFSPLMVAVGVGIGLLVGILLSRMSKMEWNEEESKIITRIDWIGGVILVLYLLFSLNRSQILGVWLEGDALAAVAIGITTGTMLGRVIGTVRGIRELLSAWGVGA